MRLRVWSYSLDQPATVVEACNHVLDPSERDAAAQRRTEDARERTVVARGGLRMLLGAVTESDPAGVRFDRRCRLCGDPTHGKPRLASARNLSFSLTHSGAHALVAVSYAGEVGIDAEVLRPRTRLDALATRALTQDELVAWGVLPDTDRLARFLEHWTAKEAYLKAIGIGLTRPLRTVTCPVPGWTISTLAAGPDLVAAVAVEGSLAAAPPVATWRPGAGVTLDAAW
jgi:4'-phosphopantetheinyl transferase